MSLAPLALAFERTLECRIYQQQVFERPVLDLGCGDGLFAKVLFADRVDTGVDSDPRELDRARKLGVYRELIGCSGESVPKPAGSYNTIFSNSVLEHIREVQPVLDEAFRLLAPGGRFYFTVPSDWFDRHSNVSRLLEALRLPALACRARRLYNRFWKHHHYHDAEGWEARARRAGFEIVGSEAYDPRSICQLNDFLVPFSAPAMLVKRLTGRWVLFPALRRQSMRAVRPLARRLLRGGERADRGGLLFVAAGKAGAE